MTYNGYTINAIYNATSDSNYPAVTVTVNYNTINGYVKTSIPIISPYGFISVPMDNQSCAYTGVGQFNAATVIGYTNSQPPSNVPTLAKGESCMFSNGNYVFSVQNKQLYVTFTNDNYEVINTRATIDENVNTILIDTIAEIAALETKVNDFISKYNLHVHTSAAPGSPTSAPLPPNTETAYTATSNFTRDKSFLGSDGANNFIDKNGKLIS